MNDKLLIFFIIGLFCFTFVNADFGIYEINNNLNVRSISNGSSLNISVYYPNSTVLINNQPMTQLNGNVYNYTLTVPNIWGEYKYNYCNTDGTSCKEESFHANLRGEKISNIGEGLAWLLFIIAIIGNITFLILIMVKLVTAQETIFGVLSAWGFYLLMIIVNYQSGLMTTSYIFDLSDLFITIFTWSNGVLPVISLVVTMFIKGTQKKKPIPVDEITGRTPFGRYI